MSETYAELVRVREMTTDSQVGWYDRKAITAVLARLDALERPVTEAMRKDRARAPDISETAWDAARTIVCMWPDVELLAEEEEDPLDFHEWQVAAVVQGAIDAWREAL